MRMNWFRQITLLENSWRNNDFNKHQHIAWIVSRVDYLRLCWGCYQPPITGSFIPTPKWILTKCAMVNVLCFDDNSFQYSVLVGMNLHRSPQSHKRNYPSHYKRFLHLLNMDGILTPVHLSSIDKFENQNFEISVNVLHIDDDDSDFISVRMSKFCRQRKYDVNLLMLIDCDKFHYTSIRSLSRMFAHRTKHDGKKYVCQYCLHAFSHERTLKKHLHLCWQFRYLSTVDSMSMKYFYSKDTCTEYAIIHTWTILHVCLLYELVLWCFVK